MGKGRRVEGGGGLGLKGEGGEEERRKRGVVERRR